MKRKQRGTAAPKVIKTNSVKATVGKNTAAPRRTRSAGSVKMEVSVASNGSNRNAGKSTRAPQSIKSGKVTIARTSGTAGPSPRPATRSTATIPAAKAATATVVSAKAVATRRTPRAGNNVTNNNNGAPAKTGKRLTPLQKSIETARSVVANPRHPKHDDVKTLLESHQKQFITDERFIELLKNLLF